MENIKNNTVRGVKWSAIERFSVQGVTFVVSLVMARLLTPSDFGMVGMLSIFLAISQTFIDSGFTNALIRKIDRTELDCSTAFYFNVVIGAICYALLYFLAPLIADFYNMPLLTDVTRVLAITLFINSFTIVQIALLTIKVDFRSQAKINLITSIISGSVGIYMAYTGWGVWALVYHQICRSLLNVFFYWTVERWRPLLEYSWTSFHCLFSFGGKLLLSGLLHTFYLNITNLVIGKLYTSQDLGFFERGQQIGKIPMETTVSIIQRVTFPILATIQDENEYLISVYRKYIKATSILVFLGMFLLASLAKPIIVILLTDKWSESVIYLQLYCISQMLTHITRINLNLLQVKGRSDLLLRLEIIKKTISLSLLLIASPFGIIAICLSQIIYSWIALYLNTYYTDRLFGFSLKMQIKDFSKYLIAAFFACLPSFIMVIMGVNNYVCIIAGPIAALVLYSLVLLRKDFVFIEVKDIALRSILKNNKY